MLGAGGAHSQRPSDGGARGFDRPAVVPAAHSAVPGDDSGVRHDQRQLLRAGRDLCQQAGIGNSTGRPVHGADHRGRLVGAVAVGLALGSAAACQSDPRGGGLAGTHQPAAGLQSNACIRDPAVVRFGDRLLAVLPVSVGRRVGQRQHGAALARFVVGHVVDHFWCRCLHRSADCGGADGVLRHLKLLLFLCRQCRVARAVRGPGEGHRQAPAKGCAAAAPGDAKRDCQL
ncbi:hypothetical protein D3C87_1501210 [compost metagenome]